MSKVFTNRQREIMYRKRGEPILALEFDVFDGNQVSMWAHTRHDVPFAVMKDAFEAIQAHIASFLADGEMCPFNPEFRRTANAEEQDTGD